MRAWLFKFKTYEVNGWTRVVCDIKVVPNKAMDITINDIHMDTNTVENGCCDYHLVTKIGNCDYFLPGHKDGLSVSHLVTMIG